VGKSSFLLCFALAFPVLSNGAEPLAPRELVRQAIEGCRQSPNAVELHHTAKFFSVGGHVRVNQMMFCPLGEGSERENYLFFLASPMSKHYFTGPPAAPSMVVTFRDANGEVIYQHGVDEPVYVSLPNCGYEFYAIKIPLHSNGLEIAGRVYDFSARLGKTAGEECKRMTDWDRIKETARRVSLAYENCSDPNAKLDEGEVAICEAIKQYAASSGG
jgi:hypothetical protein